MLFEEDRSYQKAALAREVEDGNGEVVPEQYSEASGAPAEQAPADEAEGWGYSSEEVEVGTPAQAARDAGAARPRHDGLARLGLVEEVGAVAFARTDVGNAEAFVAMFGDVVRYDHKRRRWIVWQDRRWREDAEQQVIGRMIEVVGARRDGAVLLGDVGEVEAEREWAERSESAGKLKAGLRLARTMPRVSDDGSSWDADGWLLGVANGLVDLREGTLRPAEPSDAILRWTEVPYHPEALCPRWEQFVDEVLDDDGDLVAFVRRAVGHTLTGDTSEQVVFVLHGTGENGKSRFLAALRHVLGPYAVNLPFSALQRQGRSAIPNDIATIAGARFVTASETREDTILNEERLKALTGEDAVTARFLYREFFTFAPEAKLWLAVNHLPHVNDQTAAFWRRMRVVPFPVRFAGERRERDLARQLRDEAAGILRWAVEGCLDWQAEGLDPPASVVEATANWRGETDPLGWFLAAECDLGEELMGRARRLYLRYHEAARRRGLPSREVLSETAFGRRLSERFAKAHDELGNYYIGIGLRHENA